MTKSQMALTAAILVVMNVILSLVRHDVYRLKLAGAEMRMEIHDLKARADRLEAAR